MTLNESYIYLDDLRFHAFHGVMPQERLTGNDYTIDIKIGYDVSLAMVSDNVDDTLNYAEVYKIVDQEMGVCQASCSKESHIVLATDCRASLLP